MTEGRILSVTLEAPRSTDPLAIKVGQEGKLSHGMLPREGQNISILYELWSIMLILFQIGHFGVFLA